VHSEIWEGIVVVCVTGDNSSLSLGDNNLWENFCVKAQQKLERLGQLSENAD